MTTDKADIKLSKCRSRSGAKSPQESLQRQAILLPLRKTYHHFEESTSRLGKKIVDLSYLRFQMHGNFEGNNISVILIHN